jgi:hypothetical protein
MSAKKQQTHAKRARELAVKERRERKRAKKAEAAALRAAGISPAAVGVEDGVPDDDDADADDRAAGFAPEGDR